jgi:hypothetical protein
MKDYSLIQSDSARRENRLLLAEGVSFEKATELAKGKKIPVGSVWYWALSSVYGPVNSAKESRNAA